MRVPRDSLRHIDLLAATTSKMDEEIFEPEYEIQPDFLPLPNITLNYPVWIFYSENGQSGLDIFIVDNHICFIIINVEIYLYFLFGIPWKRILLFKFILKC